MTDIQGPVFVVPADMAKRLQESFGDLATVVGQDKVTPMIEGEIGRLDDGFTFVDTVLPAKIYRTQDLEPIDFDAEWAAVFEAPEADPLVPPWPLRHLTAAIRFGVLQPRNWTR